MLAPVTRNSRVCVALLVCENESIEHRRAVQRAPLFPIDYPDCAPRQAATVALAPPLVRNPD